jgi:biotin carboxyl carrier protein
VAFEIALEGAAAHEVEVARHGARATITIDGRGYSGSLRPAGDARELTLENRNQRMWIVVDRDTVHVHAFGRAWVLSLVDPVERARHRGVSEDVASAPMPGTVITVAVQAGQPVTQGEQLVVIESMKMQSEIVAVRNGVVESVFVQVGETFERGAPLVALTSDEAGEHQGH